MGFIRVENFADHTEWVKEYESDAYSLAYTDWPSLMDVPDKPRTLRLMCYGGLPIETYFEKVYPEGIYFKTKDGAEMDVSFPEMCITLKADAGSTSFTTYSSPADFTMTVSLWDNTRKLREWFIPLKETPGYTDYHFDLTPLIEEGECYFTKLRFTLLQAPANMRIYFGDLYLYQEDIIHNVKVSIAKLLHLKHRMFLGLTSSPVSIGDTSITLSNYAYVFKGTPLLFGDPQGYHELHIVGNDPIQQSGVTFTGEFSGKTFQTIWPAGTPVHIAIPALFGDLSQSEEVFPVFYISTDAPEPMEGWGATHTRFDSYVRDTAEQKHQVATRKSIDNSKISVEIHVYSNYPEIASDMWKFLRSVVDEQTFIPVAGESVQYDITNYRQVNQDPDSTEILPHFVLELDCYVWENVYARKYGNFPYFKSIETTIDSLPFAEVII